MSKKFKCSMCGECCRHIDKVEGLKHFAKENGSCKYLDGDKCKIYHNRPDLCRYDKVYRMVSDQFSKEEFDELCTKLCNKYKEMRSFKK